MQKYKILISHSSIYRKGGWGRIYPLAIGLAKSGNHVTIITTSTSFSLLIRRVVIDNVNIIIFPEIIPARISRLGFGFLSLGFKMLHVIMNKYDIVHSDNGHRPLSGLPCRLSKIIHKSVYVAEWYDWYGRGGQYDNKKKLFKVLLGWYELWYEIKDKQDADGVVVLSELLADRARAFKSIDRIRKIHGGADVYGIPFLFDNSEIKLKNKFKADIITLGYINSYSYNAAEFLPLVEVIIKFNLQSKFRILLFGESGSLKEQLPLEAANFMIFYGWIDFYRDFEKLQCVDVFFLFKEETLGNKAGWPNCIGDYLACGRPVLLNPVGEVVEFVKEYPFAFICTTKEQYDIYDKLKNIIIDRDKIKDEGKKIRELAENNVSWESKSMQLLSFYHYLIHHKN